MDPDAPPIVDPDLDYTRRWDEHRLTEIEVLQVREAITANVETVTVRPREKRGRGFDPARVEVTWR